MIKNLNCFYCYNNSCAPTRYYVKVKNNGNLSIRYILQYSTPGEGVTKQANLLSGEYQIYYCPQDAFNICLNILNISLPSEDLIYHGCVSGHENICYEIEGTVQNPICRRTFC